MRAGRLDQRVTIQAKTVTGHDDDGGEIIGWTDVETVWMEATPLSGREYVAMRAAQSDVSTRFACRYRAGLTTAHRLLWRGVPHDISEIIDRNGRRVELEILAVAQAVAT